MTHDKIEPFDERPVDGNGELHGLVTTWNKDRILASMGDYVHGVKHGLTTTWNDGVHQHVWYEHGKEINPAAIWHGLG